MGKRVTIHDIAREAGVSAATVSYVINDTQGQSISEDTKNKIWHVINMFNYKPNVFAKNLRSSGRKLVAVCTETEGYTDKAELVDLLEGLSKSFKDDFDLVFVAPPFGRITNADAIIAYNVSRETFYTIGNANYIPLIAVNCCVEDKLFFQITPDFEKLRAKADNYFKTDYAFVCPEPNDAELKNRLSIAKREEGMIEIQSTISPFTVGVCVVWISFCPSGQCGLYKVASDIGVGACGVLSGVDVGHGAGHMGAEQVTVLNLDVIKVDAELNVIAVRGAIPGPKGGIVYVKNTVKTIIEKHAAEGGRVNPQKQSARVNPQKASARNK